MTNISEHPTRARLRDHLYRVAFACGWPGSQTRVDQHELGEILHAAAGFDCNSAIEVYSEMLDTRYEIEDAHALYLAELEANRCES